MSVIFTTGEPAGIGVDLAIINAQKLINDFLVFADADVLKKRAKLLNLPIKIVDKPATKTGEIFLNHFQVKEKVECGVLNANNAQFILNMLNEASKYCLESKNSALLTGPIHKGIINKSGTDFTGHTEYLRDITKTDKTVMMLATDKLRVALASTHVPLAKVAQNITSTELEKTIKITHYSLKKYGLKNPKISICGLNPHAGENGYLGDEEINIINPLIKKLNLQGFNLYGSISADTAFTPNALKNIDCVLCMYHDQGLPVLKTIGFKKAVNITLGLPFIRTSVDHGTALELAGTGNISLGSLNTAYRYTKKWIYQTSD